MFSITRCAWRTSNYLWLVDDIEGITIKAESQRSIACNANSSLSFDGLFSYPVQC